VAGTAIHNGRVVASEYGKMLALCILDLANATRSVVHFALISMS